MQQYKKPSGDYHKHNLDVFLHEFPFRMESIKVTGYAYLHTFLLCCKVRPQIRQPHCQADVQQGDTPNTPAKIYLLNFHHKKSLCQLGTNFLISLTPFLSLIFKHCICNIAYGWKSFCFLHERNSSITNNLFSIHFFNFSLINFII